MSADIFDRHYRAVATDPQLRARLVADPGEGLKEFFGSLPGDGYRIEIVEQASDTLTLLLPKPTTTQTGDDAPGEVGEHIYDLLFTGSGVGGYVVPNERLGTILKNLRSHWSAESTTTNGRNDGETS